MTIQEFEEMKCDLLVGYGCPQDELWLTECITREDFIRWHGEELEADLNTYNKKYVVYYHENGNVYSTAFFDTLDEFKSGCEFVASYLVK